MSIYILIINKDVFSLTRRFLKKIPFEVTNRKYKAIILACIVTVSRGVLSAKVRG
jgi:hypothetical protein